MPLFTISRKGLTPFDIYYNVTGEGPIKVIFIGGLGQSERGWNLQNNDFQVCTFDNRGHGQSGAVEGFLKIIDLAQDAVDLIQHLQWEKDIHVVGISMGGMISLELGLLIPEKLASMTLISTTAGATITPFTGVKSIVGSIIRGTTTPEERAKLNAELLFPPEWLESPCPNSENDSITNREYVFKMFKASYEEEEPRNLLPHIGAVMLHYVSQKRLFKLKETGIRFLIMTGDTDNLVRPSNSHYLAKHLGGKLIVMENSGHVITIQHTESVNKMMEKHFYGEKERE